MGGADSKEDCEGMSSNGWQCVEIEWREGRNDPRIIGSRRNGEGEEVPESGQLMQGGWLAKKIRRADPPQRTTRREQGDLLGVKEAGAD